MHILILAQHYAPEEVSGAVLATELAEDLVSWGHQVTFVTSAPSYPKGVIFPGYKNRIFYREERQGVRIIRIWSYISPKKTFWRRIFNYGTFSISTFYGGLFAQRPDVVFSASPPLSLGLSAWLLSKFWRIPWLLRVEDIFPDAAVEAGILTNKFAIRFFHFFERFLYKRASHISVISDGFRRNLINKRVPENKLSVVPVWADPQQIQPGPKNNSFRKQHNLTDKFIVLYAGNIGYNTALEDIIEAAKILRQDDRIRFVIVGEGVKKHLLESLAANYDLDNVNFLPYQPRALYNEMLAAADMSVVTLNAESFYTSLPSKIFNIMASGRPVLSITPSCSEIAAIIEKADCGINIEPSNHRYLAETISELSKDSTLLTTLGQKGRAYFEKHYTREQCIRAYERTMRNMVHTARKL